MYDTVSFFSDTQSLDHKYTVGIIQFPFSDTQSLEYKHIVGMTQFPYF